MTGPDEYTTVVDNNAYTNLMAKENLEGAVHVDRVAGGRRSPAAHAALVERHRAAAEAEVDGWRRAAELMYIPRHEELGIVLQDEHFLERKPLGLRRTRRRRSYPLLLHYHPLELYRHQVIKQTDVVLATYLVGRPLHARRRSGARSASSRAPASWSTTSTSRCACCPERRCRARSATSCGAPRGRWRRRSRAR